MKKAVFFWILSGILGLTIGLGVRGMMFVPSDVVSEDVAFQNDVYVTDLLIAERKESREDLLKKKEWQDKCDLLEKQIALAMEQNEALRKDLHEEEIVKVEENEVAIPRHFAKNIRTINAIESDYSLGEGVMEILKVTEEEKKKVDDALIYARVSLDEIELRNATLVSESPTNITISIASLDADGVAVKKRLISDLSAALGEERGQLMMEIGADQLDSVYNDFGQNQHVVTIISDISDKSGRGYYIKSERQSGDCGSSAAGREKKIPEKYRYLLVHLGENFRENFRD